MKYKAKWCDYCRKMYSVSRNKYWHCCFCEDAILRKEIIGYDVPPMDKPHKHHWEEVDLIV